MKHENEKKSYVYLLIDPRDQKIFYVGKGVRKRALDHLKENPKKETKKHNKINEIQKRGQEVKIELLRTGLTNNEAIQVEAATIDLIGQKNLTNIQTGHHSKTQGMTTYSESAVNGVEQVKTKDWKILEKEKGDLILLVSLNQSYSRELTPQELYDATRHSWGISKKKIDNIKYVLGIFQGIVKSIYIPVGWYPAGTTFPEKNVGNKPNKRLEFVGHTPEQNICKKFLNKSINIKMYQKGFKYLGELE